MKQGWQIKKLGDVCEFQNGYAFKSNTYKESGLPILRITNIQNNEIDTNDLVYFDKNIYKENLDRFQVFKGDLLIAMSGATTGKLGINNSDTIFYLNQRVGKFIPSEKLDLQFLYYCLSTKVEESLRIAVGAAQPNLSTEQIKNSKIPLPPLSEQKRIVSILDRAFAAIDKAKANTEKNLHNAKELFESYLQGVFEERGEGWEEKILGDIATFRNGLNFSKSSKGERIKIVGVKDFKDNFWIPFSELDTVLLDGSLNKIDELRENDIIAVRSNGNPELIGRTILAGEFNEKVSHSGFTIRVRLNEDAPLVPAYLAKYLKTRKTRKELIESGNGISIKSLNQGSLSLLKILFPKSKSTQLSIIPKLNLLQAQSRKLECSYQHKLNDLDELKKSILQKAFSGELKTETSAVI